jgi:hypothetical protein
MVRKGKKKVPKRIAGVKVPKDLRRKAEVALTLVENPAVRQLAAAALTAAAGALASSSKSKRAATRAADEAGDAAAGAGRAGETAGRIARDIALAMVEAFEASLASSGAGPVRKTKKRSKEEPAGKKTA